MDTPREATQTSGKDSSRQRLVSWLRRPHAAVATAGALLGLLYLALRPLLIPAGATVYVELGVIVLLLLGFLLTTLAALGLLVVTGVAAAVPRLRATRPRWYARANRTAFTALFLLAGFTLAALVNDQLTYAPPVRDAAGDEIAGGIASLEKIELGGTTHSSPSAARARTTPCSSSWREARVAASWSRPDTKTPAAPWRSTSSSSTGTSPARASPGTP